MDSFCAGCMSAITSINHPYLLSVQLLDLLPGGKPGLDDLLLIPCLPPLCFQWSGDNVLFLKGFTQSCSYHILKWRTSFVNVYKLFNKTWHRVKGYQRRALETFSFWVWYFKRVECQCICSLVARVRSRVSLCKFALFWCSERWGG